MATVDELELGREPIDWEMECLRQDRDRGRLVTKIAKIQAVLAEHDGCPTGGCGALDEIQDVINDAD
jgi:hypothetical protein